MIHARSDGFEFLLVSDTAKVRSVQSCAEDGPWDYWTEKRIEFVMEATSPSIRYRVIICADQRRHEFPVFHLGFIE